ncbi:anoctamin-4 isoform X2 [Toxorhynchites rutilus septentrionalis]|uniref:anoctamin-4 isoform X2 n=1 Tax=Toxorhynchites rutilus septentrionalis TaxID=329112 RepID=UPI0024794DF7|nr:anoctamin-4 isoform X2 [Toxorhynchites rutilus septentrionalis]
MSDASEPINVNASDAMNDSVVVNVEAIEDSECPQVGSISVSSENHQTSPGSKQIRNGSLPESLLYRSSLNVLLPNFIEMEQRASSPFNKLHQRRAIQSSPLKKVRRYSQGAFPLPRVSRSISEVIQHREQDNLLMRYSTDNIQSINSIVEFASCTVDMNGGIHSHLKENNSNYAGSITDASNKTNKFFATRTNSTNTNAELETHGTVSTASIHPSDNNIPHVADGTTTKGYHRGSEETANDTQFARLNVSNEKTLTSLDDIMESPLLKTPVEKWLEAQDRALEQMRENDDKERSKIFGPKIANNENIPGTPMDASEIASELNKSINSSTVSAINERRRSSTKLLTGNSPVKTSCPDENDAHGRNSMGGVGFRNKKRKFSDNMDHNRRPSKQDKEGLDPESLMFRDGRRKIDMVLCYEEEDEGVMTEMEALRRYQRKIFQENLVKEGLEVEVEHKSQAFDEKTYFVKIHIPWRTESRYAEVMNLKLPVKRFITISVKEEESTLRKHQNRILSYWNKVVSLTEYNHSRIEKEPSFYSATACGNPEEQFIVKDRCTTYNSAQRSLIVMQILMRTRFDETEKATFVGIRRLLNDSTYLACFPLHEGRYDRNHSTGAVFDRRLLYLEWARPIKWYKKQPLCLVRKYFGDKIALYFCWLGFYTKMLYAPAIVGLLCFLYGLASMNSKDNIPTKEICDSNGPGNVTLCPLCDKACSYQRLSESCLFAKLTYLFDNPSTVFFAIFMSFWATTFLELWKRKQSVLVWEWDLQNIENEEDMRPEFETSVKTFRTNPVTREKEPFMPTWDRAVRFMATSSAVLFMICVVLGAVLGTIIYRISLVSVIYSGGGAFFRKHAKLFTTMTAALINLVIIMILTRIYHRLAIYLTNLENPRTQTEYEDSYTIKIFVFEFMNFYSSLIYIAFFKGRFYDYPGDDIARKSEFYRLKGDICDPAGCLSELCIQLAIIMVGKQCWNNFMEYFFPAFYNWWRQRKHKQLTKDETHLHMAWEQDYHLQDPGRLALFDEYLEMIVQYGFVTLFVAAFPLAPLFALLNNIAEIRLDAYKMVTQSRRPLAERVEDIGAWYRILKIITYTAVVSNAFVIAYTSDFIPRMVYKYVYSPQFSLHGYIEHSLSVFNTSDYKEEWGTKTESDPDTCHYRGYRNSPTDNEQYGLSPHYWHVFAARLAFVVIFEHIVFVLTGIMQFIIPDIPDEVKTQIQREQMLAKEAKYQHGLKKSRDTDYEEILHALREQSNNSRQGVRGSWARRLSRLSDGLDAHVEVANRPRQSMESTVWEVT